MDKNIFFILLCFTLSISAFAQETPVYAEGTITIKASPEEVWAYLADDNNAQNWSIFFSSITPCPEEACPTNKVKKTGEIGHIRRSHRNSDQSGLRWDEETIKIIKEKLSLYKAIRAHDFVGYGELGQRSEHLVEQIFNRTENNETELTFRSSLYPHKDLTAMVTEFEYSMMNFFFKYVSKGRASEMFQKNLENIKAAVEMGDNYQRVHPYKKYCEPDEWLCFKFLQDF